MDERCKPPIDSEQVPELLKQLFELTTIEVSGLTGYEDSNFFVRVKEDEDPLVLKVSNAGDSAIPELIEELNRMMEFCAVRGFRVPRPFVRADGLSVVRKIFHQKDDRDISQLSSLKNTTTNETRTSSEKMYAVRLMYFVSGKLFKDVEMNHMLLFDVGKQLASLHSVTQDFESQVLRDRNCIWSLASLPTLTTHLSAIADTGSRELASHVISNFVTRVVPVIDQLESLYVHGDPNEANILVRESGNGHEVYGMIDFGDSHFAPRIFDLAAACLYMMLHADSNDKDILSSARSVIDGYTSIHKLTQLECDILPICIQSRLVQSLVLGALAIQQQPDNHYILTTAINGWKLLRFLNQTSFKLFDN